MEFKLITLQLLAGYFAALTYGIDTCPSGIGTNYDGFYGVSPFI
jgi:hypothetical protein